MNIERRKFIQYASLSPVLLNSLDFRGQLEESAVDSEENTLVEESETEILGVDTEVEMPKGRIGNVEVSRLIAGGNIISGIAHSRDLIYVSSLMKHYFTDKKILETLALYEQFGINTAILRLDNKTLTLLKRYWTEVKGKIQWIAQIKPKKSNLFEDADIAIDNGAIGVYVQGQVGDDFVRTKDTKLLGRIVEHIRNKGVIAGIGAHSIDVVIACEQERIIPDFYMKTFHPLTYWSAKHPEQFDNKWDLDPDKTMKIMRDVKVPWIAFKVLAGGAIPPKKGFSFAFANGADFICVGMFDFQVKDDVRFAIHAIRHNKDRSRPWYG